MLLWPLALAAVTWRWQLMLRVNGVLASYAFLYYLYWTSSFFTHFLPAGVGGDVYRFVRLQRRNSSPKAEILSSIVLERAFGVFAMALFVSFFGMAFTNQIRENMFLFATYGAIIAGMIVFVIIFLNLRRLRLDLRRWPGLLDHLRAFLSRCRIETMSHFFKGTVSSCLALFIAVGSIKILFLALGYPSDFLLLLYLVPLINFTEIIPISINALGIKEGAAVYLFLLFGYPAEVTFSVFLINRLLYLIVSLIGGLGSLWKPQRAS